MRPSNDLDADSGQYLRGITYLRATSRGQRASAVGEKKGRALHAEPRHGSLAVDPQLTSPSRQPQQQPRTLRKAHHTVSATKYATDIGMPHSCQAL